MKRRLPKEEMDKLRRDGLDMSDEHLQLRVLTRLDLGKVKRVFEEGEMYQVGKHKYRAVLKVNGATAFVIFERFFDSNVLKTVGVTHAKSKRWD